MKFVPSPYLPILLNPASGKSKRTLSLLFPIFGSHVRRIGWIRTIAGGTPMYLFFPTLITMHLSIAVLGYQLFFRPVSGLKRFLWNDYIIVDRYLIRDLSLFDRFNCMYCGYANGIATLINKELDEVGLTAEKSGLMKQIFLIIPAILLTPILITFELSFQIIYNLLVSRPLEFQRTSIVQTHQKLVDSQFACRYIVVLRWFLLAEKNLMLRIALALEQIESAWCPLHHLKQHVGVVYPDHHRNFFTADQVEEVRRVLSTRGTVSDSPPSASI